MRKLEFTGSIPIPRVLAFGGLSNNESQDSIQLWNEKKEEWTIATDALSKPRYGFGYLALPESIICSDDVSERHMASQPKSKHFAKKKFKTLSKNDKTLRKIQNLK